MIVKPLRPHRLGRICQKIAYFIDGKQVDICKILCLNLTESWIYQFFSFGPAQQFIVLKTQDEILCRGL